jgi:hypothetical protein
MTDRADRLRRTLDAIDAANGADPTVLELDGRRVAAERLYGERMSATLEQFAPDAAEALVIAARGQHIERWRSPRSAYPQDRAGYLGWRKALREFHARRLGEVMAAQGFEEATIARVGSLVRKERLRQDPEAQVLEDVVCLVFLRDYVADFAAKHDDDKLGDILAKTWRKMSPRAHEAALRLDLPPRVRATLESGLARLGAAPS